MVNLIDTNIIIRYLVKDNETMFVESKKVFDQVENEDMKVEILEGVIMECLFVLIKYYKLPKNEVIQDLISILHLEGIVNTNKHILLHALTIHTELNIDFVDCLLCAKHKLENYNIISFDSDLAKC